MLRKVVVLVACLGILPYLGGCSNSRLPENDSYRPLSLGDGLEPTMDQVLPECVIFSYKRTVSTLYEKVDGKRIWRNWSDEEAYNTVLEGMRRWKAAYPKAVIHKISIIGTSGTLPTRFLVQYYNPDE